MLKDINGKTIRYEDNIKDNIYILRKEDLSSGTYMFEFGNNEYSYRGKLVVE